MLIGLVVLIRASHMRDCIDRQTEGRTDRQTEKKQTSSLKPHTHYVKVKLGKGRTFDIAPPLKMTYVVSVEYNVEPYSVKEVSEMSTNFAWPDEWPPCH